MNHWKRFLIVMLGIYAVLEGLQNMQNGRLAYETGGYHFTVFSVAIVIVGIIIVIVGLMPRRIYDLFFVLFLAPKQRPRPEVHPHYRRHQHDNDSAPATAHSANLNSDTGEPRAGENH